MDKTRKLPFSVNRNDARSLVDQVADGLRQAIVSNYWHVGDEIPSTRELVPMLGVSHIVTRAALSRLTAEGYVLTRHGLHPVVRDRNVKQWRGHVLFVDPEGDLGYFHTLFSDELRTRLNRAGYLFTRATVEREGAEGPYEFSLLDAALAHPADLVVVFKDRPQIFRHLARKGVPFATVSGKAPPDGAVGHTQLDFGTAIPDFVSACRAAGIKKVVHVNWRGFPKGLLPALRGAGIAPQSVVVKPAESLRKLFVVEDAARVAFSRHISSGRLDREAAYLFADDYVARGTLMAMAQAGLRAPEDIRVATWANAGLGPAYFRPLSRMEMDPLAAGATVAAATIAYLDGGKYTEGTVVGPKWVAGETMGIS